MPLLLVNSKLLFFLLWSFGLYLYFLLLLAQSFFSLLLCFVSFYVTNNNLFITLTWYCNGNWCENIIFPCVYSSFCSCFLHGCTHQCYCGPVNDCAGECGKCFVASFTDTVCKHSLLTWRHIVPTWGNHSHAGSQRQLGSQGQIQKVGPII